MGRWISPRMVVGYKERIRSEEVKRKIKFRGARGGGTLAAQLTGVGQVGLRSALWLEWRLLAGQKEEKAWPPAS